MPCSAAGSQIVAGFGDVSAHPDMIFDAMILEALLGYKTVFGR